jgi:hypothetical protein
MSLSPRSRASWRRGTLNKQGESTKAKLDEIGVGQRPATKYSSFGSGLSLFLWPVARPLPPTERIEYAACFA